MKAIIYAAKSTADERGSIPTQLEDGRAMAQREAWEITGEFSDESASAWSGDRGPQLAAAMAEAERLSPAVLVVQHSDRLARGDGRQARHLGELYFWALKAGVELRSVQDDSTFTNPLLAFAMGERNSEDSRRKSLAVQAGMGRRAARGLHSGPRPYGYRFDAERGLAPIEHEARVVERMYREFASGRSLTDIARTIHREGIPTASGAMWRQSTVSGILRNPVYLGRIRYRGDELDGAHAAILDPDLWRRVADRLGSRPKKGRGRLPKGRHLFRGGMLRCECGESMVPRTRDGYELYYCNGRAKMGADFCGMGAIRRAEIDTAVYTYFEQVGLDVEAARQALAESRSRRLAEVRALRQEAVRETQRASARLARVRRDYTEGALDAADWAGFRDELTAELEAAEAQVARLTESESHAERDGARGEAEQEMLEWLAELRRTIAGEVRDAEGADAVRAALGRLFESFVVHRSAPGRVHVELAREFWIEPIVKPEAIERYSTSERPILRRQSVLREASKPRKTAEEAKNNQRLGSPWRYASGPE